MNKDMNLIPRIDVAYFVIPVMGRDRQMDSWHSLVSLPGLLDGSSPGQWVILPQNKNMAGSCGRIPKYPLRQSHAGLWMCICAHRHMHSYIQVTQSGNTSLHTKHCLGYYGIQLGLGKVCKGVWYQSHITHFPLNSSFLSILLIYVKVSWEGRHLALIS